MTDKCLADPLCSGIDWQADYKGHSWITSATDPVLDVEMNNVANPPVLRPSTKDAKCGYAQRGGINDRIPSNGPLGTGRCVETSIYCNACWAIHLG
jgi:hypothetical protein